ncbi:TIGR03899 family protein [Gallaecimonas sp. GXIMD4217]|uniref:TIGR03899 family protein n=1 Tax=Gallaecimonas sp. GXIMD4217 TaxID=3131927 RepID=UPI00311B3AC3
MAPPEKKENPVERMGCTLRDRLRHLCNSQGLDGALSSKEDNDILARARRRAVLQIQRRQENLEAILRRALINSDDQTLCEVPDSDWFHHFSRQAENTANPKLQELWAHILVREMQYPGSFSRRSLETLERLSLKETQIFAKAVSVAAEVKGERRILFGLHRRHSWTIGNQTRVLSLGMFGLPYSALATLMEAGLLHASELVSSDLKLAPMPFRFGDHEGQLQARRKGVHLNYYRFTPIGDELARLMYSSHHQGYELELFKLLGSEVSCS